MVAAPQTEKAIALAGIKFDGYPTFVARETGTDERDVYLMLCFDDYRVVNMHAPPERQRRARDGDARERGAHDPRDRRGAEATRHRRGASP